VKFVAKIASDLAKPDGQRDVPEAQTRAFLAALPVGRLWGVGPKTEEIMVRLGLKTIGDIAAREADWLESHFGSGGKGLWELAHGIDPRAVVPDREAKSIGAEDTFEEDIIESERLKPLVHSQSLRVGRRTRRAGIKGRVVQLKLKYSDFQVQTRRLTLSEPTDDGQAIYREALLLLERSPLERAVRLTGVSLQDFADDEQLPLFEAKPQRSERLNATLDKIAQRFGAAAVTTADLAGEQDDEDRRLTGASLLDAKLAKPR
jgi:DNA polymerase-4